MRLTQPPQCFFASASPRVRYPRVLVSDSHLSSITVLAKHLLRFTSLILRFKLFVLHPWISRSSSAVYLPLNASTNEPADSLVQIFIGPIYVYRRVTSQSPCLILTHSSPVACNLGLESALSEDGFRICSQGHKRQLRCSAAVRPATTSSAIHQHDRQCIFRRLQR